MRLQFLLNKAIQTIICTVFISTCVLVSIASLMLTKASIIDGADVLQHGNVAYRYGYKDISALDFEINRPDVFNFNDLKEQADLIALIRITDTNHTGQYARIATAHIQQVFSSNVPSISDITIIEPLRINSAHSFESIARLSSFDYVVMYDDVYSFGFLPLVPGNDYLVFLTYHEPNKINGMNLEPAYFRFMKSPYSRIQATEQKQALFIPSDPSYINYQDERIRANNIVLPSQEAAALYETKVDEIFDMYQITPEEVD